MADFVPNIPLVKNQWTDITGPFAGSDVVVQCRSSESIQIWFGPTPPPEPEEGLTLPPHNWPLLPGTVVSKVWAYGRGEVHISEITA